MFSDLVTLLNQHHPMSVRRDPLPVQVVEQQHTASEEVAGGAGEEGTQDTAATSSETTGTGHFFKNISAVQLYIMTLYIKSNYEKQND